jgi:hypothetical protein
LVHRFFASTPTDADGAHRFESVDIIELGTRLGIASKPPVAEDGQYHWVAASDVVFGFCPAGNYGAWVRYPPL